MIPPVAARQQGLETGIRLSGVVEKRGDAQVFGNLLPKAERSREALDVGDDLAGVVVQRDRLPGPLRRARQRVVFGDRRGHILLGYAFKPVRRHQECAFLGMPARVEKPCDPPAFGVPEGLERHADVSRARRVALRRFVVRIRCLSGGERIQ